MNYPVKRLTPVDSHHLVGFNDLDPWSADGRKILCLRVGDISNIPNFQSEAEVGFVGADGSSFVSCGRTPGWNFPQGGRQQWVDVGGSEAIIFNRPKDGEWRAAISDLNGNAILDFKKSIYRITPCKRYGLGVNFARLYRLGGYGYPGLEDPNIDQAAPANDGIWKFELDTGECDLLISIATVVQIEGFLPLDREAHHYLTHVLPSPTGNKLAFLHRYWLADGGIRTRLMVMDERQRCSVWDEGFLSHFDWIDEESILIWGKPSSSIQALRSNKWIAQSPLFGKLLQGIKPIARKILRRSASFAGYYKQISPNNSKRDVIFSSRLPTTDGHPSFCPSNRDLLMTDTYPDDAGMRDLLIFDRSKENIVALGNFKQEKISISDENLESVKRYIDAAVLRKFSRTQFAYSRSGVHCDLHPRWKSDGKAVCFDSTHEGTRQVYMIEV